MWRVLADAMCLSGSGSRGKSKVEMRSDAILADDKDEDESTSSNDDRSLFRVAAASAAVQSHCGDHTGTAEQQMQQITLEVTLRL